MTIELSGEQYEILDAVGIGHTVKEIQRCLNEKRLVTQGRQFESLDLTVIAPNLDSLVIKGMLTRYRYYGEAFYFPTFDGCSLLQKTQ